MEQKIKQCTVVKHGTCAYGIQSKNLGATERTKKRGWIIEDVEEVLTIPFNEGSKRDRKAHEIRTTEDKEDKMTGKLSLSPNRQRITLTISFDRLKDNEDKFKSVFDQLITGYEMDVIKYEVDECLD